MATNIHPFYRRIRKTPKGEEEIVMGPSFGRTIVVIVAVLTVGALLATGVLKANELPSLFRLFR